MKCPACNGARHTSTTTVGVYTCKHCGALHGQCYLGESYALVLPYWVDKEPPLEHTRYYDLMCLGSAGIERRHGWYDTRTRRIVQTG